MTIDTSDVYIQGKQLNITIIQQSVLGSEIIARNTWVSKGKHNLTTKARRAVVGRYKQPDEGAGGQIWKCLDPLNCVASAAF